MMDAKIEKISLFGRSIYILRDDLLGVFNGNKARKLEYFLNQDLSNFTKIVSYGSSQSNAMYSLSVFSKMKNLKFEYVCDHIGNFLNSSVCGNLKASLENGMKLYVDKNRQEFAKSLCDDRSIFIKEGVAQKEAEFGFISQAKTIKEFAENNGIKFDIFLPSGTGASACYLKKHIDFDVYTTPCVGDENYLKEQILELDKNSLVKILKTSKKYHYAKPHLELYDIWKKSCMESKIEFDLVYDPIGLKALSENINEFKNEILYIHQGGILGNPSQLQRYEYKFKLKHRTI